MRAIVSVIVICKYEGSVERSVVKRERDDIRRLQKRGTVVSEEGGKKRSV